MDVESIQKWSPLIGAAIAFIVGLYQWADARRRDIEQKRFEQFHRAFEWVAGRTAEGQSLVDTQQAMAIYELTHFPEYKDISLPILDYYLERSSNEQDTSLIRGALIHTKAKLEGKK
jgi:hypothetical protein